MLMNMGAVGSKEIEKVRYRFLSALSDERFQNMTFWIEGDDHVWIMFDMHLKLMPRHVIEWYAEVYDIGGGGGGGLSSSIQLDLPLVANPIHYAKDEWSCGGGE
ncbi:uncharacterized protein DS421_20g703980 [Arachis hypogaea]|nr:uncharacterized protein DS421_20g703980 [Arachis hypogaea]